MVATPTIQPNSTITGPALPEPVEVHAVTPMGTSARIMGVGRRTGNPFNAVLTADQLAALDVLTDRDAFYASPQLPRLLAADVIKRTIADGVSRGELGYATKNADGALKLVRFKEPLAVEIDEEHFILQAAEAQKLLEPPRLATIAIEPGYTTLGPGGTATFKVTAKDQYGQPFAAPAVTWTAKGGEIAPDGTFTAGTAEGNHSVSATAGDVTAAAEVRIQKAGAGATGGTGGAGGAGGAGVAAGKQRIAWSGEVPSQKWTKFYSQVLAKFAVGSDLKIRVTFEATVDAAQAKAKLDEARVQLRELGLNDDVT